VRLSSKIASELDTNNVLRFRHSVEVSRERRSLSSRNYTSVFVETLEQAASSLQKSPSCNRNPKI
jgi:hypothetical protein